MNLLLPLALALSAPTPDHVKMLPPDIDDGMTTDFLSMFREPPLWTAEAATGYRSRMRVTLLPNIDLLVSARIDERNDGELVGTAVVVRLGRGNAYSVRKRTVTHFKISHEQMAELEQLLAKAGAWKFERTHWPMEEGEICIDGLPMIFERVTDVGYRYAEANAVCDAPAVLTEASRLWLRVAGVQFPWSHWGG